MLEMRLTKGGDVGIFTVENKLGGVKWEWEN
jgi:hypothetical protein